MSSLQGKRKTHKKTPVRIVLYGKKISYYLNAKITNKVVRPRFFKEKKIKNQNTSCILALCIYMCNNICIEDVNINVETSYDRITVRSDR
jgi:hypothetical protein